MEPQSDTPSTVSPSGSAYTPTTASPSNTLPSTPAAASPSSAWKRGGRSGRLNTAPSCPQFRGDAETICGLYADRRVSSDLPALLESQVLTSRLLRRRGSAPLAVEVDEDADSRMTRAASLRHLRESGPQLQAMSPGPSPKPRREIKRLSGAQKISDLFSWESVLREDGDGGKVVVCQAKEASQLPRKEYSMKIRFKESLARDFVEEEFRASHERLLNLPPHVGALPLLEVLEDECCYYVVMERAPGGTFLPSLASELRDGVIPEITLRHLMQQILVAVKCVHEQGRLHCGIKPDNLVMQLEGAQAHAVRVALLDFNPPDPEYDPSGSSKCGDFPGQVHFTAPEAIAGRYSQASDLYSVGIILYMLMAGKLPYPEYVYDAYYENIRLKHRSPSNPWRQSPIERRCNWKGAVIQRMKETPVDWACSPWPELPGCRALCERLLSWDPLARPASAAEALADIWLAGPLTGTGG